MNSKCVFLFALLFPVLAAAQLVPSSVSLSPERVRVLSYTPIPGPEVARRVCAEAAVTEPTHSVGGSIAGGLLGALVGSRFGGGHGKDATTIAGAIGGAMAGDRIGANAQRERCTMEYQPGLPVGYQVTFKLRGSVYTVMSRTQPGEYVMVRDFVSID